MNYENKLMRTGDRPRAQQRLGWWGMNEGGGGQEICPDSGGNKVYDQNRNECNEPSDTR